VRQRPVLEQRPLRLIDRALERVVADEGIYFGDIAEVTIPKDMLGLAEHILETKAATFDSSKFRDRYEAAIVAMINEKRAGLPVSKQRELPRVVAGTDLMSALRQSIERAKEAEPKAAAVAPKGKKTPIAQC
jgi:DNA end-binding protein Ku